MVLHLDWLAACIVLVARSHHTVIYALVHLGKFVRIVPVLNVWPFAQNLENGLLKPSGDRQRYFPDLLVEKMEMVLQQIPGR